MTYLFITAIRGLLRSNPFINFEYLSNMQYITGNKNQGARASTFQNALSLRQNMTMQEKKVWDRIKNKQLLNQKFRRQHTISSYILDFFCVRCKLCIEIDGQSHVDSDQRDYDKQRTEYLNEIGIVELRFKNEEVDYDLNSVINKVLDFIKDRMSSD